MTSDFPHERLDVYHLYLRVAGSCADIVGAITNPLVVTDHLDRAMESIGVNLMRANAHAVDAPLRASFLDVSIASTNECAAALDVCLARRAIKEETHRAGLRQLWRLRGMLLGLKRVRGRLRERSELYGSPRFPFADLDMYKVSLETVRWMHQLLEEANLKSRIRRKLDISSTGTVLNIAEGHGRATAVDQDRFMRIAQEHAFQTVLSLDLLVARRAVSQRLVSDGKIMQARVISMLYAWCARDDEDDGQGLGPR